MNHLETIQQLGGFGRLKAMVGAYNFAKDENSVSFRFKGSRKANHVSIELNSSDLYNVRIGKVGKLDYKIVDETKDAYSDMLVSLFENTTGLYLSL